MPVDNNFMFSKLTQGPGLKLLRHAEAAWGQTNDRVVKEMFQNMELKVGFLRTFCSDSSSRSRRGRRHMLTSSRMRSPWRSMISCAGQQRWSRCSVAAHSKQTGRSHGWQKSRSSWPGWREQRTGRQRRPRAFSSSRAWTEWDAVLFCRLRIAEYKAACKIS